VYLPRDLFWWEDEWGELLRYVSERREAAGKWGLKGWQLRQEGPHSPGHSREGALQV